MVYSTCHTNHAKGSDRSLSIMVTLVRWSKVTVNGFVNRHTTGTPLRGKSPIYLWDSYCETLPVLYSLASLASCRNIKDAKDVKMLCLCKGTYLLKIMLAVFERWLCLSEIFVKHIFRIFNLSNIFKLWIL